VSRRLAWKARRLRDRYLPRGARGPWALPEDRESFDLFLLMGQSNMAGYGGIHPDDPCDAADFEPQPGVLVLGGQASVRRERSRGRCCWRPAAHPLHSNQRSAGFGLGLPFALELRRQRPQRAVGLIPCAWGGAPIAELEPGTPLFGNALKRARLAARRGRLRAVLWHQGESDAVSEALAAAHAERLHALAGALRNELGEPRLPFLIGDLAEFTERQWGERDPAAARRWRMLRGGLRRVAAELPDAALVPSEGLEGVDAVHFGRAALIEFGRRYARAFLECGGAPTRSGEPAR